MESKEYELREFGDPILERVLLPVPISEIGSRDFNNTVDKLIEILKKRGVGVAANQFGKELRVFIVWLKPNFYRPEVVDAGPIVVINPVILESSSETETILEACMSLSGKIVFTSDAMPGPWGSVPRSKKIKVKYLDRAGKEKIEEWEGLKARVFQHEIDHLNGISFTERMAAPVRLVTGEEYKKKHA